jgi:electron transport complex protein RnfD
MSSISSPMQFAARQTATIMQQVLLAATPAILISTWFFGYGLILNLLVSSVLALALEALALKARGLPIKYHLADSSVLVTALLFAVAVPPGSPWWLLGMGIGFAVALGKHVYGGLGHNVFNPAMAGYLFLLLAFPLEMTTWHLSEAALNLGSSASPLGLSALLQNLQLTFPFLANSLDIDGLAMATPLIESKMSVQSAINRALAEELPVLSRSAETGWEWINIAYLVGGLFLLARRVISWHIPFSIIATVICWSDFFYSDGSSSVVGTPYLHLFGSATMLGAFFIATDPVSAATSNPAKIAYGIIIGSSIYAVRVWGSYLDSIAIAVLFGNFLAPLLDHFFRPRIYGQGAGRKLHKPKAPDNPLSTQEAMHERT